MQVINAENTMDALWKMLAPLQDEIPIYKHTVDESQTDLPQSYLLLRSDISDSPEDRKSVV